jgi:nucleotide-binding universal stress UspA family protein
MNPIICVTEFTALTREALRTASALAHRAGESVLLVHSVDEREQFPFNLRSHLLESDAHRLAAEARELRDQGYAFEDVLLRGMPEDGVASFAWRARSRLIVTGSTPTAVVEHWALGCIAEEISDTSLVPVLAVRSATSFVRWLEGNGALRIVVGFDPLARPDALLNRLDELQQLAACTISAAIVTYPESKRRSSSAELISHGSGSAADSAPILADELARRNIPLVDLHSAHDATEELLRHARAANADLIVVATHPRDDLTLLPHPALAHRVLRRATMNVLCVPESDIEPPHATAHAHDEQRGPWLDSHAAATVSSSSVRGGA